MGTKKLQDFQEQLDAILQDKAKLILPGDKDRAIELAIDGYSKDRPLVKKFDFAGDGAAFDIPTPNDWARDFSEVVSIEYPAGERDPVYIENSDWMRYLKTDNSEVIRLVTVTPELGKNARVEYTLKHTQPSAQATSTPDSDFLAIVNLAAHHAFLQLAARCAQKRQGAGGADSVDLSLQVEQYKELAKLRRKDYERLLGMDKESEVRAGSATVDLDNETQAGTDFLTHPRRAR